MLADFRNSFTVRLGKNLQQIPFQCFKRVKTCRDATLTSSEIFGTILTDGGN